MLKEELNKKKDLIIELGFLNENLKKAIDYGEFLFNKNESLNLISRKMSPLEWVDNHFIDCLLPLKKFQEIIEINKIKRVLDLGTGGGMPGIIYAISNPGLEFHLYEKSPKKQEFLNACKNSFAKNCHIHGLIEEKNFNAKTDLIIARAFKPLDVILKLTQVYYAQGGKYFLLKGQMQKIQEEFKLAKIDPLKNDKIKIIPLVSRVTEGQRHLVLIG